MDKVKINNQVVLMRKFVKQAKVRTLNKFTKEIKFLQHKKGTENQVQKYKRKSDRLLEEVTILKKIKPDSVSKMALAKAKEWKVILEQKNVPLEDRCFALLANYESVQKEVEKFYRTHHEFSLKIPMLVEEWEEKTKTPQKNLKKVKKVISGSNSEPIKKPFLPPSSNKKNKEIIKIKEKKNRTVDREPIDFDASEEAMKEMGSEISPDRNRNKKPHIKVSSEFDTDNSDYNDSDVNMPSANKNSNVTTSENTHLDSEDSDVSQQLFNEHVDQTSEDFQKDPLFFNVSNVAGGDTSDSDGQTMHEPKEQLKNQNPESLAQVIDNEKVIRPKLLSSQRKRWSSKKSSKSKPVTGQSKADSSMKAIAVLDLNELKDCDEIPVEHTSLPINLLTEPGKRKRDPFFLTSDGEVASESDNAEPQTSNFDSNISLQKKTFPNFDKRESGRNSFQRKKFPNRFLHNETDERRNNFQNKHSYSEPKRKFNASDGNDRKFKEKFTDKFNKKDSFRASEKEKFKEQKNFQSFKKNSPASYSRPASHINESNRPKNDKPSKGMETLPLHPSWEAKRKLKETKSVGFQGKKTVFND